MGKEINSKMCFIFSDFFLIGFISVILTANLIAFQTNLSLHYPWIDDVTHLAGGFWGAIFFISIFLRYHELKRFSNFLENKILTLFLALSFVALLGIGWELYEFCFNLIGDLFDTIKDLFLDLCGGLIAGIFWLYLKF